MEEVKPQMGDESASWYKGSNEGCVGRTGNGCKEKSVSVSPWDVPQPFNTMILKTMKQLGKILTISNFKFSLKQREFKII